MALGKSAFDALQILLSGAKRVDLGDMTRPVTAARKQALADMLPKVDDWGWKGGKPGELSGTKYTDKNPFFEEDTHRKARQQIIKSARAGKILDVDPEPTEVNTLRRLLQDEQVANAMSDFGALERADVPREWTGRLRSALRSQLQRPNDTIPPIMAKQVSDLMRPMTNAQREEFVALLPEWTESLEDLAEAVRTF